MQDKRLKNVSSVPDFETAQSGWYYDSVKNITLKTGTSTENKTRFSIQ